MGFVPSIGGEQLNATARGGWFYIELPMMSATDEYHLERMYLGRNPRARIERMQHTEDGPENLVLVVKLRNQRERGSFKFRNCIHASVTAQGLIHVVCISKTRTSHFRRLFALSHSTDDVAVHVDHSDE